MSCITNYLSKTRCNHTPAGTMMRTIFYFPLKNTKWRKIPRLSACLRAACCLHFALPTTACLLLYLVPESDALQAITGGDRYAKVHSTQLLL